MSTNGKREAILKAALELFAERGFTGATIADVAERAASTEKTIFSYFGTKEKLVHAVIDFALSRYLDAMQGLGSFAELPWRNVREALRGIFDKRLMYAKQNWLETKFVAQESLLHPEFFRERMREVLRPLAEGLDTLADNLVAAGELDPEIPRPIVLQLIRFVLFSYIVTRMIWESDKDWDDKWEIHHLSRALCYGLLPRKPEEKLRDEGRVEVLLMATKEILAARGVALSEGGQARLDGCTDPKVLERWYKRAITADTEQGVFVE